MVDFCHENRTPRKQYKFLDQFFMFWKSKKTMIFFRGSRKNENLRFCDSFLVFGSPLKNIELFKGFRWASIGAAFVQEVGHTRATCFSLYFPPPLPLNPFQKGYLIRNFLLIPKEILSCIFLEPLRTSRNVIQNHSDVLQVRLANNMC